VISSPVEILSTGVFMADDAGNSQSPGWLSVNGLPATRIDSAIHCPHDVVVITNFEPITYKAVSPMKNLRPSFFFGRAPAAIASDLGLPNHIGARNTKRVAELASSVIKTALDMVWRFYSWKSARPLSKNTLIADLQEVLQVSGVNNSTPMTSPSAFVSAYQSDSMVLGLGSGAEGLEFITLRRNQFEHAEYITSCPVPSGLSWEILEADDLGANDNERLDFVLNADFPMLAEVEILQYQDEAIGRLCAFGSSVGNSGSKMGTLRTHATDVEINWLSRFCTLRIKSAIRSTKYQPLPTPMRLPPHLLMEPFFKLSYSAGLVAFAHFQAISEKIFSRKANIGSNNSFSYSPRNVWLKAYDRAEMFIYALRAYRAGFQVMGYGSGGLRIAYEPHQVPDLMAFAIEQEFYAPNFHQLNAELVSTAGAV
jgi:hypothetical protein